MSYDDGSVLRRRQHRTTMAGDGSGTTKATAARRRRQRSVSTADNGASYEDNGIGLSSEDNVSGRHRRRRHRRQHQSRPLIETTINRRPGWGDGDDNTTTDGGWGRRDTTISLNIGREGRWSGLDRVLSLGGEGLSLGTGGVFAGGGGTRELIVP